MTQSDILLAQPPAYLVQLVKARANGEQAARDYLSLAAKTLRISVTTLRHYIGAWLESRPYQIIMRWLGRQAQRWMREDRRVFETWVDLLNICQTGDRARMLRYLQI